MNKIPKLFNGSVHQMLFHREHSTWFDCLWCSDQCLPTGSLSFTGPHLCRRIYLCTLSFSKASWIEPCVQTWSMPKMPWCSLGSPKSLFSQTCQRWSRRVCEKDFIMIWYIALLWANHWEFWISSWAVVLGARACHPATTEPCLPDTFTWWQLPLFSSTSGDRQHLQSQKSCIQPGRAGLPVQPDVWSWSTEECKLTINARPN